LMDKLSMWQKRSIYLLQWHSKHSSLILKLG
jgi:hypothetical protein